MVERNNLALSLKSSLPVRWEVAPGLTDYPTALARMEDEVTSIAQGKVLELVWLVEHPPLYTAGTSANPADLVMPDRFPVYQTGRGGQYTYHGPGQRVAYVMLNLKSRGQDVRAYVAGLESWLIDSLLEFNIMGERREDRVGVWVKQGHSEAKIAAIGIRLRHWVSFHGISLNVNPNLEHFSGIIPCGVTAHGVTSLAALGHNLPFSDVDAVLAANFQKTFQG